MIEASRLKVPMSRYVRRTFILLSWLDYEPIDKASTAPDTRIHILRIRIANDEAVFITTSGKDWLQESSPCHPFISYENHQCSRSKHSVYERTGCLEPPKPTVVLARYRVSLAIYDISNTLPERMSLPRHSGTLSVLLQDTSLTDTTVSS
ncbi:hypothetical protein BDW66DRAFT_69730 [Aspergillus desertorum]